MTITEIRPPSTGHNTPVTLTRFTLRNMRSYYNSTRDSFLKRYLAHLLSSYCAIPKLKRRVIATKDVKKHKPSISLQCERHRRLSAEPLRNNELWSGSRRRLHKSIEYGLLTNIYGV